MNFGSGAIAWGHVESKALPQRRLRRRMGLRGPLPVPGARRRPPAHPRAARGPKRAEVDREDRVCLALHAPRPASMGGHLPANAAVAQGGSVRRDDPRSAHTIAAFEGQGGGAFGGDTGLSHAEIHSRERPSRRLRRAQEQEGLQGACGGGHFGTPARPAREPGQNEDDRKQVEKLAEEIQQATQENIEIAYVDQGYTGERASELAAEEGIRLEVLKHEEAKRGFVLLPRRWVVERDFAWASRFRRLVKDYERLPETVAGLHFVAFACLFLQQAVSVIGPSP